MKKIAKYILLLALLLGLPSVCFSQSVNPFLSKGRSNKDPFSGDKRTVLIVFDASGSMEETIKDETKIHIAKRVLEDVLLRAAPNVNLGLRVYGSVKPTGTPEIDCTDSKLLIFPGVNNRRSIVGEINKILPQGFTPITFSLSQAVRDLIPYGGEKSIILISDGQETCGGDPCKLAEQIAISNIDLKVDVVGFGIKDDYLAQEQLMCVALNTNGKYFLADSAEELTRSLSESINKSVTGKIITNIDKDVEVHTEETEGYENLPMLTPEKLMLK